MDWRDLRSFRAVARHGTISGAADALGLSRTVLSRQVSRLERRLGAILLIRHPRRCDLTGAGQWIRDAADRVDEVWRDTLDQADLGGTEVRAITAALDAAVLSWADVSAVGTVGSTGSLTAAAAALRTARPALSRRIARLEQLLGTAVVVRGARVTTLTPTGQALAGGAARVDAVWAETLAHLHHPDQEVHGEATRTVSGPDLPLPGRLRLAFGLISPQLAVPHLRQRFPGTVWQFEQAPLPTAVARMAAGELDVFYGWSMGWRPPPRLDAPGMRLLLAAPYAIATSAGHRAAGFAEVRVADLAGEEWVVDPDPLIREFEIGLCRRYGFAPAVTHTVADMAAVRALVTSGQAVTWVVGGLVMGDDYAVVQPLDAPLGHLVVVWNRAVLAGADATRLGGELLALNLDLWRERRTALADWLRRYGSPAVRQRLGMPAPAGPAAGPDGTG